jgi:hypothetical protein
VRAFPRTLSRLQLPSVRAQSAPSVLSNHSEQAAPDKHFQTTFKQPDAREVVSMSMQIWSSRALLGAALLLLSNSPGWASPPHPELFQCDEPTGILCAEQRNNPGGSEYYVGHDEPSLLFYSNEPGSGYNQVYKLRLPKDPPLFPKQDGSGGTWNFQLHPAFWFGMAMCDDQGNPNPGGSPNAGPQIRCAPDSDSNIYDSPDPNSPRYIGRHPGTAFMEMQFYPPGWLNGNSATQWTAALNIDSFQSNDNIAGPNGLPLGNNAACAAITNGEYVNFAFIQTDGVPFPPGSPSPLGPLVQINANTLMMNPGDELIVTIADTEHGLKITVKDLTTGQSGFMVASGANGFASVKWDPNGDNCDFATHNLAHDFHSAYATSSEHTRVPGAAHTYNIAYSDEIGHFEYCNSVLREGGICTSTAADDPPRPRGSDDAFCFDAAFAARFGLIPIGGCADTDADFDGVPYRKNVWPGTFRNPLFDALFHAQPVIFSSPLFKNRWGHKENFSRVAFETDLPRIEFATNPPCQRHLLNPSDPNPGAGCVNPAAGADFYPIFSTRQSHEEGDSKGDQGEHEECQWQEGGRFLPKTQNDFGGNSKTEYGPILANFYPATNFKPQYIYENFHRTLPYNPCPAGEHEDD